MLAASGHGDVAAARKLIRRRAAELGLDVRTLPGFNDEGDEDTEKRKKKVSATRRGQRLADRGSSEGLGGYGSGGPQGGEGTSGVGAGCEMAASLLRKYGPNVVSLAAAEDGDPASLALASNPDYVSAFGVPEASSPPVKVHDTGSTRDPARASTHTRRLPGTWTW